MPIHVQDRFAIAISGFLTSIDRCIEVYVNTILGTPTTSDLKAEEANIDTSYKKLELNLPNVIYEYNPLSRAQNRLANQATSLSVLNSYVTHLNAEIGGDSGSLINIQETSLISNTQSHIHQTIVGLTGFLAHQPGEAGVSQDKPAGQMIPENIIGEYLSTEPESSEALRNRVLYHLKLIDDTIFQIAMELGAPVIKNKS